MLLEQISIHAWIQNNQIKTETGVPLDFKTHRFLYDIYRDESKLLVCEKAAQIGFTTMEIIKSLWCAKNQKLDIIYVLPTAGDVNEFSGGKTNRIIANNPILQEWTQDKDSVNQKQIGGNTIYYRGSWTERSALMISADWLILDEFDRSKQEILEQYESRLQHSKYGKKSIFSNPSLPDFGVDRYFKQSDQKKWHIKHACGKEYVMDESCIDYEKEEYTCPHCKELITDDERNYGEWKATAIGEWSGYWIPLWIAPWVSAKKICDYKKSKTAEYFANFVAGLPYIGSGNVVTESTITRNLTKEVNRQEDRIIIGVDTGLPIYYVLMNKQGLFYHGKCENPRDGYNPYDELEKLLIRFPRSVMVSDQGGDLIGIRNLQAKYPGRVFLCWFRQDQKSQNLIRWGEGDEFGKVLVDRNRTIQLVIDQLNDRRIQIHGTEEDWKPYTEHWLNIYRSKEIVDENEPAYGWRWVWKRKGADHWVMATIYAFVGMDKFAEVSAKIVSKDNFLAGVPVGRVFNINDDLNI